MPVSTTPRQKCAIAVQIKGLTSAILNLPSYVKSELDIKKINCGQPVFFQPPTRSQYGYLTFKKIGAPVGKFVDLVEIIPSTGAERSNWAHCIMSLGCSYGLDTERTEFVKGAKKIFRREKKTRKGAARRLFQVFPMHPKKDNTVSRSVKNKIYGGAFPSGGIYASARGIDNPDPIYDVVEFLPSSDDERSDDERLYDTPDVKNMGRKFGVRLTMIMIRMTQTLRGDQLTLSFKGSPKKQLTAWLKS